MAQCNYEFAVEAITATSPVTFTAIKSSNLCQVGDLVNNNYTYEELEKDVTSYYLNWSQEFPGPHYLKLKKGDLVAANHSNVWFRAQIKDLFETSRSREANVILVDHADEVRISIHKLRELDEEFAKYNKRTVHLILENLVPNSLKYNLTSNDLKVEFHESFNWDDHAIVYVRKMITEHCNFMFKTSQVLPNGSHLGKLSMTRIGDRYTHLLNDMLILEKYAVVAQPSTVYANKNADSDFKDFRKIRDNVPSKSQANTRPTSFSVNSASSLFSRSELLDQDSLRRRHVFEQDVQAMEPRVKSPIGRSRLMLNKANFPAMDFREDESVVGTVRPRSGRKLEQEFRSSPKLDMNITSPLGIQDEIHRRPGNMTATTIPSAAPRGRGYLKLHKGGESTNFNDVKMLNSSLAQFNIESNPDLYKGRNNIQIDQNTNFLSTSIKEKSLLVKSNCEEKNMMALLDLPPEQVSVLEIPPSTVNLSAQERLLMFGSDPPKWISEFSDISIDSLLVNNLTKKLKIDRPKLCQQYMIPSILKLRDVALIGDPRIGKTMSYLIPLLCCLLGRLGNLLYYDSLKDKDGPLVLILCSNWRSVESIYHTLTQIASFSRRSNCSITIRKLHGGLSAKQISVELDGNCSILIATPTAFLRELDHTGGFVRLCHLVLDDGDALLDLYSIEVDRITLGYNRVGKMHNSTCIPHQIILVSDKWTKKIHGYIQNRMKKELLFFSSFFESWVYSGAKTCVHLMESGEKQQFLIDFMQPVIRSKDRKIVICSNKDEELVQIYNIMRRLCPSTIMCNSKMNVHEITDIRQRWATECTFKVLVVADNCLKELAIFDADWVISYNIPSKTQEYLAIRFMCLLNHALRVNAIQKPDLKISSKCEVHLMITSKNNFQAHGLVNLLQRLDVKVPDKLKALCYGYYEGQEVAKMNHRPLCYNIKSYGRCSNSHYCGERHLLLEIEDAPRLDYPVDALVLLKVIYVKNVNQFYGQVRKVGKDINSLVNFEENFEELEADLTYHLSKPSSQTPVKPELIKIGDVGAVKFNNSCQRVKVLNKPHGKHASIPEIKVLFIDEGREEYINNQQFYEIPKELQLESNLVEVILANIQPDDREREWFEEQVKEMNKMIVGRDVMGIVSLSMGNTLWLNTVNVVVESDLQRLCPKFNVITKLKKRKIAVEHENHMEWLKELFCSVFSINRVVKEEPLKGNNRECANIDEETVSENVDVCKPHFEKQPPNSFNKPSVETVSSPSVQKEFMNLPKVTSTVPNLSFQKEFLNPPIATLTVPNPSFQKEFMNPPKITLSVNQPEKVYVSSLENPHFFCVQKVENVKTLTKLENSLRRHFHKMSKPSLTPAIDKDIPCAVLVHRASNQISCYRALLYQLNDDKKSCRVILVDYGNTEDISTSDVRLLPNKYLKYNFQAIDCKLHDVEPVKESQGWTAKVGDRMWQLSLNNNGLKKIMSVTLMQEIDGLNLVKLYDDSKDFQSDIAQLLHNENLLKYKACLTQDSKSDFNLTPNSVPPKIEWSATDKSIRLKFNVPGIKKQNLKTELKKNRLFFHAKVENSCYEVVLDLFAPLNPTTLNIKLDLYCAILTCDKMRSEKWAHLLEKKFKPLWLKPDLSDKYLDVSSDEESIYPNWSDDKRRNKKSVNFSGGIAGGLEENEATCQESSSSESEWSEGDNVFS